MIILDPYRKIKEAAKFVGIFAGVALVLVLIIIIYQKMRPKPIETPPVSVQKSSAEKQEEMLEAINRANESGRENPLPQDEQAKKQQEMTDAINKGNSGSPAIPAEEANKKTQDMLKAINEAK